MAAPKLSTMSIFHQVALLSVLLLLATSCGGNSVDSIDVADDSQPGIDPSVALQQAEVKLEEIPDERAPELATPPTTTVATAEKKKPEWLRASPFFGKSTCEDWDGKRTTISADCCKYVVANYASILASPGKIDVLALMTKDPFLNACKAYNAAFLEAIDKIENPEDENDDDAPF